MNTVRTKARLLGAAAMVLIALSAGLAGPARSASAATYSAITGAGSTWSYPAIHVWISNLNQYGLTVNYEANGSANGRNFFAGGQADWAASEIPYGVVDGANFDPPPSRGFAYMPDTAGGLGFLYNLSINGQRVTNLRLSGPVIAGIFTNQITMWNDPRIAADNPGLTLPALRITPVVRSDSDGSTAVFTQWMLATDPSAWQAYCAVVGRSPCTPTSTYPVEAGTDMQAQPGDDGTAAYVAQASSSGTIGYVPYADALLQRFPVAKVLNAAGYYTLPSPQNVGLSLLKAQLNPDGSEDLSQVYSDTDPRAYELSYTSYMIVPTDLTDAMTDNKGYTLAVFGSYALCQGQTQVSALGYAPLPVNLVEVGFASLQKIPGASLPATTAAFLAGCGNPTFSADGTDTLASTDPMPPACDHQGTAQCAAAGSTTLALTASPTPVMPGQPLTLTATVTSATATGPPAGTVQFLVGNTMIGPPVAVDQNGVATVTTTPAVAETIDVTAEFTPDDPTAFSSAHNDLLVTVAWPAIPLTTTVPVTGAFSLTVDTADTVTLAVNGSTATALMTPIVVTDTRNTYPGWAVAGQAADFTGSGTAAGASISGSQLGWVPTDTSLGTNVVLGNAVTPGAPGLSMYAFLASANAGSGYGTSTLGANLTLAIPPAAAAGPYTGSLTMTAVTAVG